MKLKTSKILSKNLLKQGTDAQKAYAKALIEAKGEDDPQVRREVFGEYEEKARKISHKQALKKGKGFESEICRKLRHIFPDAERRLEYQESKCIGVDIDNTDRFLIQAKCKQKYVSINTINEVQIQSSKDIPVLITKANNEAPMVVLPFKDFVTILEVVYGLREPYRRVDAKKSEHVKSQIKKIFKNTPSLNVDSKDSLQDLV